MDRSDRTSLSGCSRKFLLYIVFLEMKRDIVEILAPWALVMLALLATFGAILRMTSDTDGGVLESIDSTTLLYLVVAGALLLLRQIKTLSFGDVKLEMLKKVKERQVRQEAKLDDLDLIIPLLLPEKERIHLTNLSEGKTKNYEGSKYMRTELRRLRSIGLISMKKGYIGDMKDGKKYDLNEHVELTPNGRRWIKRIEEFEDKNEAGNKTD